MIREKVKNLWKLCFNDSEEFTELYFRLRYNNDINIAIQSGEEVIAALQMLPYPMTFEGEDIHTAYISGACTHPDYRNRGVMHELLSQAFARMLHNNVALSTLIPAEPWLFDYYGRSGYAPVFRMPKRPLSLPVHRQPIRALLWKCLPNILKKDMNISTGNCGSALAASSIRKRISRLSLPIYNWDRASFAH